MNNIKHELIRLSGYIGGFILFYAPFALFQRILMSMLGLNYEPTIHSLCLRIPIEHLVDGKIFTMYSVAAISTGLLLLTAFFFGPLFCGRLCPSGAFGEYLSRPVPPKYQLNWPKYLPVTYFRWGMLAGFVAVPFFDALLACSYCNFFVFDILANFLAYGYVVSFTSSLLLTAFLYLVVFSLFTVGGRGFCNLFCPVGAVQSVAHALGRRFPFVYRLQPKYTKCIKCQKCVRSCSMQALSMTAQGLHYNSDNCILCGKCSQICPQQVFAYKRGGQKHAG